MRTRPSKTKLDAARGQVAQGDGGHVGHAAHAPPPLFGTADRLVHVVHLTHEPAKAVNGNFES
jgi:hypothetical protein